MDTLKLNDKPETTECQQQTQETLSGGFPHVRTPLTWTVPQCTLPVLKHNSAQYLDLIPLTLSGLHVRTALDVTHIFTNRFYVVE